MSESSTREARRPWNGRSRDGLVSGCISPQAPVARVAVCPGGLDITNRVRCSIPPEGGTRGAIYGLSAAARRRLLRTLIRLAPEGSSGSDFASLTYHNGAGEFPEVWHRHLDRFNLELRRAYGQFGPEWVWVLEAQRRGAPHFHILILWQRTPHPLQFRQWVAHVWHRIADPTSEAHARAGTRVDRIAWGDRAAIRRLQTYLLKYLGKDDQKRFIDRETGEILPSGRMWGKTLTERNTRETTVDLTGDELAQLCRRIRRWGASSGFCKRFGKQFHAGIVLGDGAQLAQLLRGLATDSSPPTEGSP
jgi:hypothetical protein